MRLQQTIISIVILAVAWNSACGQSSVSICGRVIDCTTARPIAGAIVEIGDATSEIVADINGSFSVHGLKPGDCIIRFQAPAYHTQSDTVPVLSDYMAGEYVFCLNPLLYTADPQHVRGSAEPEGLRVTVIDHSSPEFQSSESLAQLLDRIPEIMVNYTGSKLGEATVSVRGGRAKEVLVLLDGVSINSPITGVADINSVAMSSVSRVEFYEGGVSPQFGSGAVGGVLNIITNSHRGNSTLEAGGGTGQFNSSLWDGGANLHMNERSSLFGSYSGYTAANDFMYDDPKLGVVRRANADIRRAIGSLHGTYSLDNGRSFRLAYHRLDQNNGLPGFIYALSTHARKNETRDILSAEFSNPNSLFSYMLRYSYRSNNQTFQDTANFFEMNAAYFDKLHQVSVDGNLDLPQQTRIDVSGKIAREKFSMDNLLSEKAFFDDVTEDRASIAVSLSANRIIAQGRPDVSVDMLVRLRGDYSSLFRPIHSPSIQIGTSFRRWVDIRGDLSYSKSYRAPLYSSLFWNDGFAAVGNPNLRPERIEESSAGAGLAFPILGELRFEGRYSHTSYRDLIQWQKTIADRFSPANLDGAVLFTKSLGVRWSLPLLNLHVDYSNLDQISKDRSWERTHHNKQLIFRPRYLQHLNVRYSSSHLDISYRLRSVSKRYYRAENTKWLDGFTVANLSISIMNEIKWFRWRFEYEISNCGNEEYMLTDRYPLPGRAWSFTARVTVPLRSN
ncbi:MAG: TonB-dependent receptor plug domain-containing protein [Candidatus Zixiibacteriota bacterium]